ncbi:MAG: glycosyltransferase family 4 protein [Bacteroidota bacterium]
MKILQICHRVPFPAVDGGNIAMMNMALSLVKSGNEVYQFSLNTSRHYIDMKVIPTELKDQLHMTSSYIDTKIKAVDAMLNLFSHHSYNMVRFFSMHVANDLSKLLEKNKFDIIQLETLYCTPYIETIRKYSKAKIVLRSHNVEHIIWERLATSEKNFLKKKYLNLLARRLKEYELKTLSEVDGIIPITTVDETIIKSLGFKGAIQSVPLGIEVDDYVRSSPEKSEMVLYHLGSMDWLPNLEGVEWFMKECWPMVRSSSPDAKLFLAGRDFPQTIIDANYPAVVCDGLVADAGAYTMNKQIMIVPLLSGSGMRVKIIQGLAAGKTIISTSIGAEGIDVEHEKNILIADTPPEFAAIIKRCLENENWCRQIGENGRKLAIEKYSLKSTGEMVGKFYKKVI